jgi:HSP20 family protein
MRIIPRINDRTALRAVRAGDPFSELFRHFFNDEFLPRGLMDNDWNPKVDVYEKDNNLIVKADLPGIDEKNLNVELEGNYLTIKGSKEEEHEENGKGFRRIERSSGSFSRTIILPDNINHENIEAEYKKGVLMLTIPKNPESVTKKISVKVA